LKYKHIGIDESPPYQWDFNTSILNPAWNEIRVEVFDTAGNHAPDPDPMYMWLYYTPTLWLPFIVK
jgi:hypothetical protein